MQFNEDKSLHASGIFNKYATAYQDKFMSLHLYDAPLNLFCNMISKENAVVLDLACGPGNVTKYLLDQKPDLMISGIDLAPNMVVLARKNNPAAFFQVMDCRTIETISEKYDGIVCAFCLPYLSKEETNTLFANMNDLLHEEGICYISTMEAAYEKSGYETSSKGDQVYIHYYEGSYLISVMESKNFAIVETFRITSNMTNGKEVVDLVIIARKKKYSRVELSSL